MSTKHHNLSQLDAPLPSAADMKFGIVVAEWNREITEALLEGAVQTLRSAGCSDLNIQIKYVPGTFELTLGTQFFAEYTDVDAVIALGCVVQGETRHFDFICQGVTQGITQLQIQWNMPVAFGILTVNDQQQAFDRAGGKYGNKGNEAAAGHVTDGDVLVRQSADINDCFQAYAGITVQLLQTVVGENAVFTHNGDNIRCDTDGAEVQ